MSIRRPLGLTLGAVNAKGAAIPINTPSNREANKRARRVSSRGDPWHSQLFSKLSYLRPGVGAEDPHSIIAVILRA